MASPVGNRLADVNLASAETLNFGPNGWTMSDEETNAALSATLAAVEGCQHFLRQVIVSFAAAPAAACTLTVTLGSLTFNVQFATTCPTVNVITFPGPGLQAGINAAIALDVTSPGNIKATMVGIGYSTPNRTTVSVS